MRARLYTVAGENGSTRELGTAELAPGVDTLELRKLATAHALFIAPLPEEPAGSEVEGEGEGNSVPRETPYQGGRKRRRKGGR